MQNNRKTLIITTSIIAVIAAIILINNFNMKIRFIELQTSLHKLDRNDNSIDHITLVANYELNKKILNKKISQEEANIFEFKLNILNSANNFKDSLKNESFSFIYKPFLAIINFNRAILGKEPLKGLETAQEEYEDLDIAYYFERNNYFKKAITNYEKALKSYKFDSALTSSILLHIGYCYALLRNHSQAEKHYTEILNLYNQENVAITATILLQYLQGFNSDYAKIINEFDSLEKSNKLYNLFAYEQALKILNKLEQEAKPNKLVKIKYLKARCYNKLGQKNRAVNIYLDIAVNKPSSIYAKLANRQIYSIGASLNNHVLKNISLRVNTQFNDNSFIEMTEHEKRVYSSKPARSKHQVEKIVIANDILRKIPQQIEQSEITNLYLNEFVIIKTSDGSIFKGIVKKISTTHITISSSIGIINVKKDKVIDINIEKK
jgi:tetratricopeptide (TPR) repeat protein